MALKPINPRLRVINKSNGVAKVDLRVAPGDELEVSADVAAQLGSEFAGVSTAAVPKAAPAPAKKAPSARKAKG